MAPPWPAVHPPSCWNPAAGGRWSRSVAEVEHQTNRSRLRPQPPDRGDRRHRRSGRHRSR